jgi:signal peptidase I
MNLKSETLAMTIIVVLVVGGFGILIYFLNSPIPFAAVTSGSMTPDIKKGDLLIVQGVKSSAIHVGNIIVYCSTDAALSDCRIVHRVISINRNSSGQIIGFVTKGDNNQVADNIFGYEPITGTPPSDVLGRVVFVVPLVGWAVMFLKDPFGFASVVLLLILAIVYDLFSSRKQQVDAPSDEIGPRAKPTNLISRQFR